MASLADGFRFTCCDDGELFRRGLFLFRLDRRWVGGLFGFLRQAQRLQAIHILADVDILLADFCEGDFALDLGQPLFFKAGQLFGSSRLGL